MKHKRKAMKLIEEQQQFQQNSMDLRYLLSGLCNLWFGNEKGGNFMDNVLTPEKVKQIGKSFLDSYVASLPVEELLARIKPEDSLKGIKPEDRLKGIKPEDRLKGLTPEEIEAYLNKIRKKD
ncbi:MAG: hypothetical protein HQK76_01135 [Desulfobacterales bacterium]|nr:hypothetical protein [Desulfobacterales bacterium]